MFRSDHGLLWQNARNLIYIKWGSFAFSKKLADSKLGTKKFLAQHKVAVPQTLGIIRKHEELTPQYIESLEPPFVVKPNNGYGGKGILIIDGKNAQGNFVTNSWEALSPKKLKEHLIYALDGFFSLSGGRDRVIIEKKIELTKEIELLGTFGLPDIRVIVYNMVPVMAMLRIPTKESGGKANIHGGACAVGIDIGTGKLTYISQKWKTINSIPEIGDIRGIILPDWDKVLSLAVQVQKVTAISFLGCDIVLDEREWPLVLEMNVRPGLEIQNVNLASLKSRLDRVEGVDINSVEKWVRLGRDLFSGDIEDKIKSLSGKQVAGPREYLQIFSGDRIYTYIADIRASKEESYIDEAFVRDILKIDVSTKKNLRLKGEILWFTKSFRFKISSLSEEKILLWKNSLQGLLIDPFKYKKNETPIYPAGKQKIANTAITQTHQEQLAEIDKLLFQIDAKLLILKHVRPTNLEEQKQIFIEKKGNYIPKFEYPVPTFERSELVEKLKKIDIPSIPGSEMYLRKKEEIQSKLKLFEALERQNGSDISKYSAQLFWKIHDEYFEASKRVIAEKSQAFWEEEYLNLEEIKSYVKKFNHIYGIKIKFQEADSTARFLMKWDTLVMRRGATVWKREMRSIIAHEIEGHYLRKMNGRKSWYKLLARWGANYTEIDEGIAIYNQNRFLGKQDRKYYSIFERYYFLYFAQKNSYKKLVKELTEFYNHDYERVFNYMLRIKRGMKDPSREGIFMKDAVYVNGYFKVQEYLGSGNSFEKLYIWKLDLIDLEAVYKHKNFSTHKKDIITPFSL